MLGSEALRLPDVHDVGYEDPAEPCPGCMHQTLENGVCSVCEAEFCERCGNVELTGTDAASCPRCAPTYSVTVGTVDAYWTRSLRRAWEAQSYLGEAFHYTHSHILNHVGSSLDSDGITDREQALLGGWDSWVDTDMGRRVAPPHLCLQRSEGT